MKFFFREPKSGQGNNLDVLLRFLDFFYLLLGLFLRSGELFQGRILRFLLRLFLGLDLFERFS